MGKPALAQIAQGRLWFLGRQVPALLQGPRSIGLRGIGLRKYTDYT
jgi:hypothetical protein